MNNAYLDWAATAPLCPAARDAMLPWVGARFGNASSLHRFGKAARLAMEEARESIAAVIGGAPSEVVFTSGATEADNLALRGAAWAMRDDHGRRHVLMSAIEHPAVLRSGDWLRREEFDVELIPVPPDGVVQPAEIARRLRADTAVVSLMAVNNEIGTLQPVLEAAALAHEVGALFHCDAVQALGCRSVDVRGWGVDLLSLSSHKIGGPQGAGALFVRTGVALAPLLVGGEQENQRRAGTESVAAIVGFGAAAADVRCHLDVRVERMEYIRERLCGGIRTAVAGVEPVGVQSVSAPHIVCMRFDGADAETLLYALDMEGVAAASGSACSSRTLDPSPVLLALGLERAQALSAIRFSWGPSTSDDEIAHALDVLPRVVERNRTALQTRSRR